MKISRLHDWDMPVPEAVALQRRLAEMVVRDMPAAEIRTVAGVDVGLKTVGRAAVVVLSFPELKIIEVAVAERELSFPYVPGLLSFREAPVILDAIQRLKTEPDVFIFDGQGIAHPRRLGIASHIGLFIERPCIGCAKSRLIGSYEEPGGDFGSRSPLCDGEELIGEVVRTRTRVKPVFVSIGNLIDLESAVNLVLECVRGYRLPEPTRLAHNSASRSVAA